eukprot:CAMPEP_0182430670 /NCGR_PEP_ID=MMETSP1167-20130531/42438_1 /TAXON_ID=2988 /ORGANISM="Mallomonas Sp, Strain CCMP3275" /LENGTH=39 /DNA_ID= /DNA_START= /DNA_END= /DNA_ORIENTATION=
MSAQQIPLQGLGSRGQPQPQSQSQSQPRAGVTVAQMSVP